MKKVNLFTNTFWQQVKGEPNKLSMLNVIDVEFGINEIFNSRRSVRKDYLSLAINNQQYHLVANIFSEQSYRLLNKIKYDFTEETIKIVQRFFLEKKCFFKGKKAEEILKTLLEVDPDYKKMHPAIYIACAIKIANLFILEKMLEKVTTGVILKEIKLENNRSLGSPFYLAIKSKNPAIVKLFLEKLGKDARQACKTIRWGDTALHTAIETNNESIVKMLLESLGEDAQEECCKAHPVYQIPSTPLLDAINNNNEAIVKILLESLGDDAQKECMRVNMHQRTLLQHALFNGNEAIIKLILEKLGDEAQEECKIKFTEDYQTPLYFAIRSGKMSVINLLLAQLADKAEEEFKKIPFDGWLAILSDALEKGHEAVVEWLLGGENKLVEEIFQKAFTMYKHPLLHYAVQSGNMAIVELILKKLGEDAKQQYKKADTEGFTPLYYAFHTKNKAMVSFLLSKLGDEEEALTLIEPTKNKDQLTILHMAVWTNDSDIVKLVLKILGDKAKEICKKADANGEIPLHYARNLAIAKQLLDLLSEEEAKNICKTLDCSKRTPLHIAALGNDDALVELLLKTLDKEVEKVCEQVNDLGKNILHYTSNPAIAKQLLMALGRKEAKKVCKDIDAKGKTPLHYAAELGDSDIVETMLETLTDEAGEQCTKPDTNGWTPLDFAITSGNPIVLDLLIKCLSNEQKSNFIFRAECKKFVIEANNLQLMELFENFNNLKNSFTLS